MKVIEVSAPSDGTTLAMFHQVAASVYRDDPVWVPASEMMFTNRFRDSQAPGTIRMVPVVAVEGDQPVARAVAILSPGARDEAGESQGWIGFFECLREYPKGAAHVLSHCEHILQQAGVKSVLLSKADNQLVGLQTGGFDLPQTVFTNHNPPYYLDLIKACGYEIKTKIYALYFTRETTRQVHVQLPGFTTREFNRDKLPEEILIFHQLQQDIFGCQPGYIPRTLEEDRAMVQSFLSFLQDDLVIIAEDHDGNAVGSLVCLPDIYQATRGEPVTRVRIISIGAVPRLTQKGIGALMAAHLMRNILRKEAYTFAEGSWILAHNVPPRNLARRFQAKPGREFAIMHKSLAQL